MYQFNERDFHLHVSVLGWLLIVGHAIFLLIAVVSLLLLPSLGMISGDRDAAAVFTLIGTGVGLLMALLGLPGVLAGYGLLKRKSWGRFLALVIGILGLVNFPIGTAIGIYTLFVLLHSSANDYFLPHQPA